MRIFSSNQEKVVFVVPTFEIAEGEEFPRSKRELLDLYIKEKVVYFHKYRSEFKKSPIFFFT